MSIKNILSLDVEDNFTREELVFKDDWEKYEGQVVVNTQTILDLLERHQTTATFFVLGKVAERRPEIVRMIADANHEIASHGYIHERVSILGETGFSDDAFKSKEILEALSGKAVKGYRAMAFSITAETSWALDRLGRMGFDYDSSILSTIYQGQSRDFRQHMADSFTELPPTGANFLGRQMAIGGGIFFRLAPYSFLEATVRKENRRGRPAILYAHTWEFNKDQPKRRVGLVQSLAQMPATFTTAHRLDRLLKTFSFTSIQNYLGGDR